MDGSGLAYTRFENECEEEQPPYTGTNATLAIDLQPKSPSQTNRIVFSAKKYLVQPSKDDIPRSYEGIAIVSLLFCMPLAVCAIICSHYSSEAAKNGDMQGARSKGRIARILSISAILCGLIMAVIIAIFHKQISNVYKQEAE